MSRAAPRNRIRIISGQVLTDSIFGILELHIGVVAHVLDIRGIADTVLEEYFYGAALKDDFAEVMTGFSIPTDKVEYTRKTILRSVANQVYLAFDGIWPSHHYSYQFVAGGDLMVTETPAVPVYGRLTAQTWSPHESNRDCDSGDLGTL